MEISVSEPEKVGDGLSSYLTYLVRTKTTNPSFQSPEVFVRRRFSDFLGLYQRLLEKYGHKGIIVPPAPEKTVLGESEWMWQMIAMLTMLACCLNRFQEH